MGLSVCVGVAVEGDVTPGVLVSVGVDDMTAVEVDVENGTVTVGSPSLL